MKIGLISGHGAGDSGALGCGYREADLTIEVVEMLVSRFEALGIETLVYPYDRNAYADCKNGELVVDFSDCTYVLEVHFNACVDDEEGDGRNTGTEIWVTPREERVSVEETILTEIEALGFANRGVKKEDFLVINRVKNQGVSPALIETCFIDDKDDMDLFDKDRGAVADAIVRGICEGFGYEADEPIEEETEPTPIHLEYQVGDVVEYNKVYTNSTAEDGKVPADGFTSGTITRIIEGARNPYLINDGQGWINADCVIGVISGSQPEETNEPLKVGDKVKVLNPVQYGSGKPFRLFYDEYDVLRIEDDRVVIGIGSTATAAVLADYLKRV